LGIVSPQLRRRGRWRYALRTLRPIILDTYPVPTKRIIEEFLLPAAAIGGLVKVQRIDLGGRSSCQAESRSPRRCLPRDSCACMAGTAPRNRNAAEIACWTSSGLTLRPVRARSAAWVPKSQNARACAIRACFGGLAGVLARRMASLVAAGMPARKHAPGVYGDTVCNRLYIRNSLGGLAVNVPESLPDITATATRPAGLTHRGTTTSVQPSGNFARRGGAFMRTEQANATRQRTSIL